jgi:hypothetical protein
VRISVCSFTNVIWPAEDVTVQGDTARWKGTTHAQHFCSSCGSPLFGVSDGAGESEVMLGAFDIAPTDLTPTYEQWVGRRERWLHSMGEQFAGDRTAVA